MASTGKPTGGKPPGLNYILRQKIKAMPFRDIVNIMIQRPPTEMSAGLSAFRTRMALIEQRLAQRKKPTTEELVRLEFDCFLDIMDSVGHKMPDPEVDDGAL